LVFTSNSDGKVISEYGLPEGAMLYWERKDVSALREDADARTTRSTALFTSTVLPRNRALAEGGFDPIEDEEQGEAYYGDPSPMAQDQQDQMMGSADSSIDEIAWIDNRLIFRNETMEELALRMERRYAVQIEIEAEELKEMKVNGIFDQESVSQALEALKEMIPSINYVKEGNQIIINR